jgi:hypothetical protein
MRVEAGTEVNHSGEANLNERFALFSPSDPQLLVCPLITYR